MLPSIIRRIPAVRYQRERVATPDEDFMDIDWIRNSADRCAIILHGLEGHSKRAYMRGMVHALSNEGWDGAAVNLRGCSGEPNRLPKAYHQGSSDDLATIVEHVTKKKYRQIILVGFSLGANIILKYLGEQLWDIPPSVTAAVAISTPCDLTGCAHKLARASNRRYMRRFMRMMKEKLMEKRKMYPHLINLDGFSEIRSFKQFDDRYTAPLFGFKDAEDYWEKCSAVQFLPAVNIPTLMISAADDPILTPGCFPYAIADQHRYIHLEVTPNGGHAGFMGYNINGMYWHEKRTIAFIREHTDR